MNGTQTQTQIPAALRAWVKTASTEDLRAALALCELALRGALGGVVPEGRSALLEKAEHLREASRLREANAMNVKQQGAYNAGYRHGFYAPAEAETSDPARYNRDGDYAMYYDAGFHDGYARIPARTGNAK
jgi:hypothetical protein